MSLQSAEELELMLWDCVEHEFRGYQNRLEIRIANILRNKSSLPQIVVVNIAQAVSMEMATALLHTAFRTGQLRETLDKLL